MENGDTVVTGGTDFVSSSDHYILTSVYRGPPPPSSRWARKNSSS